MDLPFIGGLTVLKSRDEREKSYSILECCRTPLVYTIPLSCTCGEGTHLRLFITMISDFWTREVDKFGDAPRYQRIDGHCN